MIEVTLSRRHDVFNTAAGPKREDLLSNDPITHE